MPICEAIDLGEFDSCEPVEFEAFRSQLLLHNTVTKWECTFSNGVFGFLLIGTYTFNFAGNLYIFSVV